MAELPVRLEERPNAEFMSPSGKVPFLKLQAFLIPEFLPIVDFVAKRVSNITLAISCVQISYISENEEISRFFKFGSDVFA